MHRKVELLSVFFLISFYLYGYYQKMPMSLLIVEDVLMPVIFIASGYYFNRFNRFIGYVLIFSLMAIGIRLVDNVTILDPITSLVYLLPYGIGGYLLKKKRIKWPIYVGVATTTTILLSIPSIGVEYMNYLKESTRIMLVDITALSNQTVTVSPMLDVIRRVMAQTMVYWGFGLEVMVKIVIAFMSLKLFDRYSKRVDYTNSIAFFHRTYGYIIVVFFIVSLLAVIIKPMPILQSTIIVHVIYALIAGVAVFMEWRYIYRVLKKSLFPTYIMLGWVIFFVLNFYTNMISLLILLSYSVYVTLNGRDNLKKLLKENIEKLKEIE